MCSLLENIVCSRQNALNAEVFEAHMIFFMRLNMQVFLKYVCGFCYESIGMREQLVWLCAEQAHVNLSVFFNFITKVLQENFSSAVSSPLIC